MGSSGSVGGPGGGGEPVGAAWSCLADLQRRPKEIIALEFWSGRRIGGPSVRP
jgi:hypothetical protein